MFYVLYSEPIYRYYTLSLTDLGLACIQTISEINVKDNNIYIYIEFSTNKFHTQKNCSYWLNTWLKNNQKLSFYWLYYLRLVRSTNSKLEGQTTQFFEFYTRYKGIMPYGRSFVCIKMYSLQQWCKKVHFMLVKIKLIQFSLYLFTKIIMGYLGLIQISLINHKKEERKHFSRSD